MSTVLVVEDDIDQLAVRCLLFRSLGHRVVGVSTEQDAMNQATALHPQCAVLDLCLPTEDVGFRLIRFLHNAVPGIRILVISGRTSIHPEFQERELGVFATFQKGTSARFLLHSLEQATSVDG